MPLWKRWLAIFMIFNLFINSGIAQVNLEYQRRWGMRRTFTLVLVASLTVVATAGEQASKSRKRQLSSAVPDANHEFDFRGCSVNALSDTGTDGSGITVTAMNSPTCSANGIVLDGSDDYVYLSPWEFGGALTVEAYVKFDAYTSYDRVFDFAEGLRGTDQVLMCQYASTGSAIFGTKNGDTASSLTSSSSSFFQTDTWVHVVATMESTAAISLYKDGSLTDTAQGLAVPDTITRAYHRIGASAWLSADDDWMDGTIAYIRFWHGEALDADRRAAQLYAERIDPTPAPRHQRQPQRESMSPTTPPCIARSYTPRALALSFWGPSLPLLASSRPRL